MQNYLNLEHFLSHLVDSGIELCVRARYGVLLEKTDLQAINLEDYPSLITSYLEGLPVNKIHYYRSVQTQYNEAKELAIKDCVQMMNSILEITKSDHVTTAFDGVVEHVEPTTTSFLCVLNNNEKYQILPGENMSLNDIIMVYYALAKEKEIMVTDPEDYSFILD